MTSTSLLRIFDRVGCSLSAACALHCLATPLFLTLLSISPVPEEAELPMMIAALMIAAVTFSSGFVRNASATPLVLLLAAGPMMVASRCVHQAWLETTLLVAGAVLLSAGHVVNLRRGHGCTSTVGAKES